jgi:hypothetical protein
MKTRAYLPWLLGTETVTVRVLELLVASRASTVMV